MPYRAGCNDALPSGDVASDRDRDHDLGHAADTPSTMADVALPALFDPVLDYLADHLPPQLYDTTETLLTHAYSLVSSLYTLARTLVANTPMAWDPQQILPPLITLLAAYLALYSFYRTAGWMIRTTLAFVKWGVILSTLGALAGYVLANANADGGAGLGQFGGGLLPALGGMLLGLANPGAQDGGRGARTGAAGRARTRAGQRKAEKDRPKAWESWDKHRDWQYSEQQEQEQQYHQRTGADGAGVQQIIGNILGSAGQAIKDSGIWEKAKEAVDELGKGAQAQEQGEAGSSRRRRGKGKDTQSR